MTFDSVAQDTMITVAGVWLLVRLFKWTFTRKK